MTEILYCKTRDVKSPRRYTPEDAGVDWYIPNYETYEGNVDIGEEPIIPSDEAEEFLKDLKEKNAGRDILYVEPATPGESLKIIIGPHERILIPSGIKVRIKRNWLRKILHKVIGLGDALNAENKSGVANKKGLEIGSKVVDYEYQGEVHLSVINTTNKPVTIESGEKLVQFIHYPIYLSEYNRIPESVYNNFEKSKRGAGGFGSSNTK